MLKKLLAVSRQYRPVQQNDGKIRGYKQVEKYKCVFSDSHYNTGAKNNAKTTRGKNAKSNLTNKKRKERRKIKQKKQSHIQIEANQKHIKNLSNKGLSNHPFHIFSKGNTYYFSIENMASTQVK